ncbi:hypothetical protein VTK73DRAFT_5317 [Phialemonium thermophilum]|uniref:CTLH domain-containing protein n=1 Tax=Phialemonium thermophilum TaxID=223376 RepID=A0ABR3Y7A7_9PEZI
MMIADNNGYDPSNGASESLSNGSRAVSRFQTNGWRKSKPEALNGTSRGKQPEMAAPATFHGHDREEVTRLLIQALEDMGYSSAADSVSKDSGIQLESPTVTAFRRAILDGSWTEAEELLAGAQACGVRSPGDDGLLLAPGADISVMKFWIRQQKFLELLESRDTARALVVLRNDLTPLCRDHNKLHFLCSLLMCQSATDLRTKAAWDGAYGQSRQVLLSDLSRCISPSVMLPEHRLADLLQQVKSSQISHCLYHTAAEPPSLYFDHTCDRSQFPSEVVLELDKHSGEVWQVLFSHDGSRMATCGQDRYILIWDVPSFEVVHELHGHGNGGVGNVAWSPDDKMLVTCGHDRFAKLWNTETGELMRTLEKFEEPVSSCVWVADGRSFITGSFDKSRAICQWNLQGDKIYTWTKNHRTEGLALSPDNRWLVAMDDQCHLHVYNFETRDLEYEIEFKARPTSISISQDSRHLLVNKADGEAQLIDISSRELVQKYTGHKGGEYLIRSGFGGANESFVISGSEDGYISIWHKLTGIQVGRLHAHHPRCNAASWSPTDPYVFASCGDDKEVKIWSNKDRALFFGTQRLSSYDPVRSSAGWNPSGP